MKEKSCDSLRMDNQNFDFKNIIRPKSEIRKGNSLFSRNVIVFHN